MKRLGIVCVATTVAALAGAAPASAWWAETAGIFNGSRGVVYVNGLPGERLDLTAVGRDPQAPVVGPVIPSLSPTTVVLRDPSAPVTDPPAGSGQGCTKVDDHTLRCTRAGAFAYVWLELQEGDDRVTVPARSLRLFLTGGLGAGDNTVDARSLGGASLTFGGGNDRITLRGSEGGLLPNDGIYTGGGDDVIDVFNGATDDNPVCGDGQDVLYRDVGEVADASCETQHERPGSLP